MKRLRYIVSLPNSRSNSFSLANEIAKQLNAPVLALTTEYFPDGEMEVHGDFSVSPGTDSSDTYFLVQSFAHQMSDGLIEVLLAVDLLKRKGAEKIVLIAPYLPYCRQPAASLAFGRALADAGVSSVIACHIHDPQLLTTYPCPLIQVSAVEILVAAISRDMAESNRKKLVVVAPDRGAFQLAQKYAEKFGVPYASLEKKRISAEQVKVISLTGDVQDKLVLLADDMCSTAGTLASAAKACREKGAKEVFAAVTHALLVGHSKQILKDAGIHLLWTTDSCVLQDEEFPDLTLRVSSLSSPIASCIQSLAKI